MKVKYIIPALIVLLTASAPGCGQQISASDTFCATRYPVVLVHGIAFRDRTLLVRYWGKIPEVLKSRGASVYFGGQEAYGLYASNARALKNRVTDILRQTGAEKVNIIAHSRGGIEARYMISRLDMAGKVASLTTVATPHRGSSMADMILDGMPAKDFTGKLLDLYAKAIGDKNPMSVEAGRQLTVAYMKSFNRMTPDMKGVYYQSYCSVIDKNFPNPLWSLMFRKLYEREGPNDGLVSVSSGKWGRFRGVLKCRGKALVSHSDVIGMHYLTGVYCFDAPAFFVSLVNELKKAGY